MLKSVFRLSLILTSVFLVLFLVRQIGLSSGIIAKQTELASDLITDFLSSPGAVFDLLYFLVALVLLHLAFALVVAICASTFLSDESRGKTIRSVTVLMFMALVLTVLIWIAIYFPLTMAGFLKFSPLATESVAIGLSILVAVIFAAGLLKCLFKRHYKMSVAGASFVIVVLVSLTQYYFQPNANEANVEPGTREGKPNIVIIGVDALRPDHLGINGFRHDLTPRMDAFIGSSLDFKDAFTPIARTYTAWFTLLSGQYPLQTGIRHNLQKFSPDQLTGVELQKVLSDAGYHKIYGMDERRFNNIDERYGFDEDIGPAIGAADFLLFHASELPLVALVSNTPAGKWLFPFIYGNRGIHGTYIPETFNREVYNAVQRRPDKPLFLSLHLTLPHWPYLFRDFTPLEGVQYDPKHHYHYSYQIALKKVDDQFGQIMDGLDELGVTENALIILMSDHGEGFMLPSDALSAGDPSIDFPTEAHGHGTNVLDEEQFHVVLALKDTSDDSFQSGRSDTLVSLLDVAPTVTDFLGFERPEKYQGESLFEIAKCQDCDDRKVFLESSVSTNAMFEEDLDVKKVMAEGIGAYRVDADGLAIVRGEVKTLLSMKQRAVVTSDHIVAHFPGLENDFLVVERDKGIWWPSTKYGGSNSGQVLNLMRDLCRFYRNDEGFDKDSLCKGAN